MTTQFTTSADGTRIAYEVFGPAGAPTLVWVHGATAFRALSSTPSRIAELTGLRVVEFDRRGRGESGDTQPYALDRELDDIRAVIDAVGGRADALLGESSGGVLALEAARAGVPVDRVIAYEPPVIVDDSRPPLPDDYVARLDAAAEADDAAEAFRIFLTDAVGLPPEMAGGVTFAPNWEQMATAAHTIRYDGRFMEHLMRGSAAPLARFADVGVPVLVGIGGDTWPAIKAGGRAVADAIPGSRVEVFPGGTHETDPELVGATVAAFVRGES
jgi:pimeloyl-ACP methyl ester carboxylesterase